MACALDVICVYLWLNLHCMTKTLFDYFSQLRTGKIILWCYLIWYLVMAWFYFDARLSLWVNSLGISIVIGSGLVLGVLPAAGIRAMDKWAVARLFIMPLCVSSFAALIKGQGFMVIFSPRIVENMVAIAGCAVFVIGVQLCKYFLVKSIDQV